jgi:signal transduction histidine kinase/ActR/RegA family two-component response regulator
MADLRDDIRTPDSIWPESPSRLVETERRFRAFVTATSDVVYSMSPDWREMRFLAGKEFIADTHHPSCAWLERYIHPDDRTEVLAAIEQAIRNKSTFELEHRVIRADGTLGWTFSRAIPLLDAHGRIVEWFGTARDVTERKRTEQELRDSDRRKDEFIAVLAHELRNPLAPLINAVQLLRRAANDVTTQHQALAMIERQTLSIAKLVDDLMEMARVTSGRLQLQLERVSLADVVERSVEIVSALVAQRQHSLRVTLPSQALEVHADAARVQQIIVNLLNNAAKYTDDGGHIDLYVSREGELAVLRVRDTGIGIEPELMPRLFQPFTQSPSSIGRSRGGLGIGLSLVRRLVELHGGTIEARSEVGAGSEFIVKLPVCDSATAPDERMQPAPSAHSPARSLRVLVVDDDVDAARSLAMLLEGDGHIVALAHDGMPALSIAAQFQPHIALVDIGLPQLDGYELARQLRANPQLQDVQLVAITGYGHSEDSLRSYQAGYDEHLVKPVKFTALEALMSRAAQRLSKSE